VKDVWKRFVSTATKVLRRNPSQGNMKRSESGRKNDRGGFIAESMVFLSLIYYSFNMYHI
jgi:hypothetical protein